MRSGCAEVARVDGAQPVVPSGVLNQAGKQGDDDGRGLDEAPADLAEVHSWNTVGVVQMQRMQTAGQPLRQLKVQQQYATNESRHPHAQHRLGDDHHAERLRVAQGREPLGSDEEVGADPRNQDGCDERDATPGSSRGWRLRGPDFARTFHASSALPPN